MKNIEYIKNEIRAFECNEGRQGKKTLEFVTSNQQNAFVSKIYIEGGMREVQVEIPDFVKGILGSSYDKNLISDGTLIGKRYNESEDESVLKGGSSLIEINKDLFKSKSEGEPVLERLIISGNVGQNLTGMFVGQYENAQHEEIETILSGVTEIIVRGNTEVKVKNISRMFVDMPRLRKIDISKLDLSEVEGIENVFEGCPNLERVYLGNLPLKFCDLNKMINGCEALYKIHLDSEPVDLEKPHIVKCDDQGIKTRYVREGWEYPQDLQIVFNGKSIYAEELYNLDGSIQEIIRDEQADD